MEKKVYTFFVSEIGKVLFHIMIDMEKLEEENADWFNNTHHGVQIEVLKVSRS